MTDNRQQLLDPKKPRATTRLRCIWCGLPALCFVVLCVFLLAIRFSPPGGGPFPLRLSSEGSPFVSKRGGFSMRIPASWFAQDLPGPTAHDPDAIASIFIPGRSFPRVTVSQRKFLTANMADVLRWGEELILARRPKAVLEELQVSGEDHRASRSYQFASESVFGDTQIRCVDWYFMYDTTATRIMACSEEKEWSLVEDVFREMADSFELEADGSSSPTPDVPQE